MAFVDRFLSHYSRHADYSKTSKFETVISIGGDLLARVGSPTDLRFQCEVSELPGYNINTVEGKVYGATYAVAANPVFNELNLTFICAGDMWEKRFFDDWMEYILPKQNFLARYRNEYVGTITVTQYSEVSIKTEEESFASSEIGNIKTYRVKFLEAFPTSVAPIALNWADDSVNRLAVTFKYRRWERELGGKPIIGEITKT